MTTILSLPDGFAPPADRRIWQQPTGSPKRFWSSRLENVVAIIVISKSSFEVREGVPKEIEQQICDNIKWIRWSFFILPFLCFLVAVCLSLTTQSHTCSARLASTRWWWAPRRGSFTQIREVALLWLSGFHIMAKYILSVAPHNAKVQRSNSCRGHRGHCGDQQRSS